MVEYTHEKSLREDPFVVVEDVERMVMEEKSWAKKNLVR